MAAFVVANSKKLNSLRLRQLAQALLEQLFQLFQGLREAFDAFLQLVGGHLVFGMNREILQNLPWYYFLEFGAASVLGIAGMFWSSGKIPRALLLAVLLVSLGIILFASLDLTDKSVFSIKFGYVVHLCLFLLSLGFLDFLLTRRKWTLTAALCVLLVLPAALVWAEGGFQPFSTLASRLRRRGRPAPADAG